jgi:drug/metabolite transporter (DMT)-like permease
MNQALVGTLYVVAAGLLNAVMGVFFSQAGRQGMRLPAFGLVMGLSSTAVIWCFCDWPVLLAGDIPRWRGFVPILAIGGSLSWCGLLLMMVAMRRGHQAGSWMVTQSAMVVPLLAGILIWGDRPRSVNLAGGALLLGSIVLFGVQPAARARAAPAKPWFFIALLGFLAMGVSQTLLTVPSHWPGWSDPGRLRVPVMSTAATIFLATACVVQRCWPRRHEWIFGVISNFVGLGNAVLLFAGMDRLAERNLVALAFPLSIGTGMVGFAIYSRVWLREPLGAFGGTAVAVGLVGLCLLAIGP